MLNEEYKFELENMERDFTITYINPESGKTKKQKIDLVVFENELLTSRRILSVFVLSWMKKQRIMIKRRVLKLL